MASTCFGHLHVHLQEFLYTRLFHCRMWCYALGVVAAVLRIWCVVMCTVCQLVSSWKHVEAIYENKIIVKLFGSSWYISLLIRIQIFVQQSINF